MISFKMPKKDIKDIILTYSKQNNLPEHYEEQLVIMIESSDYVDYFEMAKIEKERIEFEKEYNQIASEKNHNGSFNENIEKRRSKSDYVDFKTSKSCLINTNYNNNKNEIDYEIIDKNDFSNNVMNINRSQSFYESSNTNKVLKDYTLNDTDNKNSNLILKIKIIF